MPTYSQAGKFGPAAVSGAPVGVPLRVQTASGSDAVLYADASKNKTVGPVVQSDEAGNVTFFADPGTYTVRWTGGSTTVTVSGGAVDSSGSFDLGFGAGNFLDVGEEVFGREFITTTGASQTTGQLRLAYFTARETETTTQVRVITGATAAAATPTLCRIGLWEIAANGDGRLVAATANDTTLFAAATTPYTRSWTAPCVKQAGQRYALGSLVVSAAAVPSFTGHIMSSNAEANLAPRLAGIVVGLSDLGDFTNAAVAASGLRPYGVVLP